MPTTVVPAPSGDAAAPGPPACPALPTLEQACREWLVEFGNAPCGPVDCEADVAAEGHGIRVHSLYVNEYPCTESCSSGLGILGQLLEVPNDCGYADAYSHWAKSHRLVLESSGRYWPAVTARSFSIGSVEQTQEVKDLVILDSQHVRWTERRYNLSLFAPDGDTGGRLEEISESRHTVWLSPDGPKTRHVAALVDEFIDGTFASQVDGETEEELRERTVALEEAQRAAKEARVFTPDTVPEVHELPPCTSAATCSPVCTVQPSPQN